MKAFFKAAGIRMLHTMAQAAIGFIGTSAVILTDVNWEHLISAVILSGIISLLKSIMVGLPEVEENIDEIIERWQK